MTAITSTIVGRLVERYTIIPTMMAYSKVLEALGEYYWKFDAIPVVGNFLSSIDPTDTLSNQAISELGESLRKDGDGNSIHINATQYAINYDDLFIPYQNGFTVEQTVKMDAIKERVPFPSELKTGGVVDGFGTLGIDSFWAMRFDNFNTLNTVVTPVFTIINRNTSYNRNTHRANMLVEVRGSDVLIRGNTYHFMATIRPSDDTIEFWVNGISQGSASLNPDWYDNAGASQSVLDGSIQTAIKLGLSQNLDSADTNQDSLHDDLKIHLLEADQAFATQQSSFANYT